MRARTAAVAIVLATVTAGVSSSFAGSAPQTQRASVSSAGVEASGASAQPELSANGRYLVFVSAASDLVANDTNGAADIFRRDLKQGKTIRVSMGGKNTQANGPSSEPTLSADGRYLSFVSGATNLAKKDKNDQADVFVRDLKRKKTQRISLGKRGAEPNCACFHPVISANGKFVAFSSFATNLVPKDRNESVDVFLRNVKKRKTTRVSVGGKGSQANGDSYQPSISANGQFVAFASDATNLAKADDNGFADVFVRDVKKRRTVRASRGTAGAEPNGDSVVPSISANGKTVAYASSADNLVDEDSNGVADVFVGGVSKGAPNRVSVASDGTEGDDESLSPALSGNGRVVSFHSYADNLVGGDENDVRDVFVRNVKSQTTTRASVGSAGAEGDGESFSSSLSANGRLVAFGSAATNLVGDDTNDVRDVFVR